MPSLAAPVHTHSLTMTSQTPLNKSAPPFKPVQHMGSSVGMSSGAGSAPGPMGMVSVVFYTKEYAYCMTWSIHKLCYKLSLFLLFSSAEVTTSQCQYEHDQFTGEHQQSWRVGSTQRQHGRQHERHQIPAVAACLSQSTDRQPGPGQRLEPATASSVTVSATVRERSKQPVPLCSSVKALGSAWGRGTETKLYSPCDWASRHVKINVIPCLIALLLAKLVVLLPKHLALD